MSLFTKSASKLHLKRIAIFAFAAFTASLMAISAVAQTVEIPLRQTISSNQDWKFFRVDEAEPKAEDVAATTFNDAQWESVSLPHTPRIETVETAGHPFLGVCWYRRHIAMQPAWQGKRVTLTFNGAMQVADVWINGVHRLTHLGGYLPFSVDLTDDLAKHPDTTVAVRLDNRANPIVPPGKAAVDFCYFGGLYRDAFLTVSDPLHITNSLTANQIAGGGVFVRYENVSEQSADVLVQADVKNESASSRLAAVRFILKDASGAQVAAASTDNVKLSSGEDHAFKQTFHILAPKLWTPDQPNLYTLESEVSSDEKAVDQVSTRIGIRSVAFNNGGFFLNGKPLVLRGADRHQDYPYLGNAESDNVSYRDIVLLKEEGYNFLRLAHYPQSPALMNACDELGMMVSVCTPGWQYFNKAPEFLENARRDIREMIRWHRNHPSAIMWEVTLNETYGHDDFYAECAKIAHEEYPGDQMLTSGDTYGSSHAGYLDIPYPVWVGGDKGNIANATARWKKAFAREYGDYNFGGQNSTSRQPLGAGEEKLLLQAWNHQWQHNHNVGGSWFGGDCLWAGIDDASQFADAKHLISYWGPLSYFRLPKFSYYFYQSQRDPLVRRADINSGPMVYIANYWTPRPSPTKVVVYSNCQEVALYLNGNLIARRKPDNGPDSKYGVWRPDANPVYMAHGENIAADAAKTAAETVAHEKKKSKGPLAMFDGGNCLHLDHAPFTFPEVTYASGELKAIGYINGQAVVQDIRRTPGKPSQIKLEISENGKPLTADGADAVFVRALVCDANGTAIPDTDVPVHFVVSGAAKLVSPATISPEAGIASALIQSTPHVGAITITVSAEGLAPATIQYTSRPAITSN